MRRILVERVNPRRPCSLIASVTRAEMSTEIRLESANVEKSVDVQVLPCHIAYDGPSRVSEFFKPRPNPADENTSISFFRGRKLCGKTVDLPKDYSGIHFIHRSSRTGNVYRTVDTLAQIERARYGEEDDDEDDAVEKVHWQSSECFKTITVWDHHVLPESKQDHWIRGVEEWIVMAAAVITVPTSADKRLMPQDTIQN